MINADEILDGKTLAARFVRGELEAVISGHARAPAKAPLERAAVVGAYAWTGRLTEATALHTRFLAGPPTEAQRHYAAIASCWLAVGWCHAGRPTRALAVLAAGPTLADDDPRASYRRYGLAFIAYFRGRMARCTRLARPVLAIATAEAHPFLQLLCNDLLGHAAWHLGRGQRALRLLGNAASTAADLGLRATYDNLVCTSAIVRVQARPSDHDARAALAARLAAPGLTYFSQRHGHVVLAIALALTGAASEATRHRAAAAQIAVEHDQRGAWRLACAEAVELALAGDRATARVRFDDILAAAGRRRHLDIFAETAFLARLVLGEPVVPPAGGAAIARADIARLRWALAQPDAAVDLDDPLLREAAHAPHDREALQRAGLLGLLGARGGAGPSLHIDAKGVLVRDATSARFIAHGSPVAARLATALASGPKSKQALVSACWPVGRYHPGLHDGPLYTAISRLRQRWGMAGAWIERTPEGYQLRADVTVDHAGGQRPPPVRDVRSALLAGLTEHPQGLPVADLARAAKVSTSTALRALRTLVTEGELIRVGAGTATRYCRRHAR